MKTKPIQSIADIISDKSITFIVFTEKQEPGMSNFSNKCFVCNTEIDPQNVYKNGKLNLPVCDKCKGTQQEKEAEKEFTNGLADGFVCGCI